MKKGDRSQYPLQNPADGWSDVGIQPEGAIVKRVVIYGRPCSQFGGVEFYDAAGVLILKAGSCEQ